MEGRRRQHALHTAHGAESDQQYTPANRAKVTKPQPPVICVLCNSHALSKGKCRPLLLPVVDFVGNHSKCPSILLQLE